MTQELIDSPLADRHERLGAKLVGFAGWSMPVQFEGTIAEHEAVRSDVGVFDVSHLGTVWIEGADALDTVARTFTNDPTRLEDGECQYTLCCDDDGGILDDLIVYRLASDRFLAVPNAANTATVVDSLRSSSGGALAEVEDASTEWAIVAVQGPRSIDLVDDALGIGVGALEYMQQTEAQFAGTTVVACRTGYTGEVGCELVVPADAAGEVWDALTGAGATPAGLAARDTLRLEMGYPLHGNDITPDRDPFEARLGWAVKLDGRGFRGEDALARRKEAPRSRLLRGLVGSGRRPPRQGMTVHADRDVVGEVTSGSFAPTLGVGIGLAYLDVAIEPGDSVTVDVRGTEVEFEVANPPFVDRSPKR
ncbi:MAG: glycine cleavage system aminomethyltransferase GcvT [Nitriliruptorales bacterium]|nr:glycine cleavage system aminomethyltransferase GcvT [Nitriliruptorales bacterium]